MDEVFCMICRRGDDEINMLLCDGATMRVMLVLWVFLSLITSASHMLQTDRWSTRRVRQCLPHALCRPGRHSCGRLVLCCVLC